MHRLIPYLSACLLLLGGTLKTCACVQSAEAKSHIAAIYAVHGARP